MADVPSRPDHDRDVAAAFDGQAEAFERAPVQTDRAALERLVAWAALPAGSLVLDAGCGPGLVGEAFLEAGHRVVGVDLSAEMVRRARARCARFGGQARFEQGSVQGPVPGGPFDAAISRYVVHHVVDPLELVRRQVALVRPGGVVVVADQTTDPDPGPAHWHQEIERARDRTHTTHLTPGGLIDLLASAGLRDLALAEEPHELDFDEWFDRGTPALAKAEVRAKLLAGRARGLEPERVRGAIRMRCWRAVARGVKSR